MAPVITPNDEPDENEEVGLPRIKNYFSLQPAHISPMDFLPPVPPAIPIDYVW